MLSYIDTASSSEFTLKTPKDAAPNEGWGIVRREKLLQRSVDSSRGSRSHGHGGLTVTLRQCGSHMQLTFKTAGNPTASHALDTSSLSMIL
mmetsp:Transcript_5156/g.7147  ORF Transcript_5156/g.7147 Transcript_5156/m.7147 type:complete len:91 (+) Transcript_5156:2523-2795(+)